MARDKMCTNEILEEIRSACERLDLPPGSFVEQESQEAYRIQEQAKELFVVGNPRSWWLALKHPAVCFDASSAPDGIDYKSYLPFDVQRCWFIAETDSPTLPVFDVDIRDVWKVLAECQYMEYYLVSKSFEWLLIENDHNQVIVSVRD